MGSRRVKQIVICCDGTGQTIRAALPAERGQRDSTRRNSTGKTNVLRMFDLVRKDSPDHIACYDPGIGTLPGLERESGQIRRLRNARDEWLGTGLMGNVGEVYRYLMEYYEPGDRIFLFGFSRGAFTVRALAGMIRSVGLLFKGNETLLPYARDVFENMADRHRKAGWLDNETNDDLAREFRKYSRPDPVPIAFLGVWDTVKAYGYLNPTGLPHVRNNELVEIVRHAVSIDEKRPPFQVTGWSDRILRQQGLTDEQIDHRIQEVWFAGDHSDVGGGHADDDNILAKAPFDWMLGEARLAGLDVAPGRYSEATGWMPGEHAPLDSPVHDLSKGMKATIYRVPRRDLNNSHFPPERSWRFLTGGARVPVDHTFPDPVWRDLNRESRNGAAMSFLRLHEAVIERYRRGIHQPVNLQTAFEGGIEVRPLTVDLARILPGPRDV
jgi:uncharacterized protein (DUF2235 family)